MGLIRGHKFNDLASEPDNDNFDPDDEVKSFEKFLEKICCPFDQVIAIAQVITTTLFLYKARKHKEIKILPKVMIVMATSVSLYISVWSIFYVAGMDNKIWWYIEPFVHLAETFNTGLLFRLARVQVQLKAQQENSWKIMAAI